MLGVLIDLELFRQAGWFQAIVEVLAREYEFTCLSQSG